MEEIWKDVTGYEGLYQVSNLGNVKSLSRKVCNITGCRTTKTRLLKLGIDSKGYYMCVLCRDKHRKTKNVHKLVAISFLNHIPNGYDLVIDHVNDNKLDNRVENLQIVTQRYNSHKTQGSYSSKYKGVCWSKNAKKWKSAIVLNKKTIFLGYYTDEHEAYLAYQSKLKQTI